MAVEMGDGGLKRITIWNEGARAAGGIRTLSSGSPKRKPGKETLKAVGAGCGKELPVEVSPLGEPLLCLDDFNQ